MNKNKQIWIEDITANPELLDSVMEDIHDNSNVYFICTKEDKEDIRTRILGVMTPVDYSPHPSQTYETVMLENNVVELPLYLMDQLEWRVGDTLDITEENGNITMRKL